MKALLPPIMLCLLLGTACRSTQPPELDTWEFAQALEGERATVYLDSGQYFQTRWLYVQADSTVLYVQRSQEQALRVAIPTSQIAHIQVTRPRKEHKKAGNILAGLALGLATGMGLFHVSIPDDCGSAGCFAAIYLIGLVPAGGILGLTTGALINTPRPRDTYVIVSDQKGSVRFRRLKG